MTIRIHDLGWPVFGDDLVQRFGAKVGMHRIRQPPAQHLPAVPVHDGDQIKEAVLDWHESDIGALDLVRSGIRHSGLKMRSTREYVAAQTTTA